MKKITVLESLRGLAALYVFLTHFIPAHLHSKTSHWGFFLRFGQEAVMLFFLLSGFVIYYASVKHEGQSFKDYFIRRALRIYPIYLVSLLFAYLVVCLNARQIVAFEFVQFLGNLFMMQDFASAKPGVWFSPFYGNSALWSLSYEWWFYMLFFPVTRLVKDVHQKWVVSALSLCGFVSCLIVPNQIGLFLNYFIIWWVGVEAARVYCRGSKPSFSTMLVSLGLLGFFVFLRFLDVLFYWKIQHQPISFGIHPVLELRHFAFSLLVLFIALTLSASGWSRLSRLIAPFSVIAPISYALYVLHYPLTVTATYLSLFPFRPLELGFYVVIAFVISYLVELPMQKWVSRRVWQLVGNRR